MRTESLEKLYQLKQDAWAEYMRDPEDSAKWARKDALEKALELANKAVSEAVVQACAGWQDNADRFYAARALRAIPSEKRTKASRENGRKGGRPRKTE